jgi:hypothetical protein
MMTIQNKLECLFLATLLVFNLLAIVDRSKEKCLITLTTDVMVSQLFSLSLMMIQNKLECFSSASLFIFNLFAIVVSSKENVLLL